MTHPEGYKVQLDKIRTSGSTDVHRAAQQQDTEAIKKILKENEHLVNERDENGWMPLHVRSQAQYHQKILIALLSSHLHFLLLFENKKLLNLAGSGSNWKRRSCRGSFRQRRRFECSDKGIR